MSSLDWDRARHEIEHAGEAAHPSPDPPAVAPGKAPSGIVIQVWCNGQLLSETYGRHDEIGLEALERYEGEVVAGALRGGWTVELRIHDGDTGEWIFTRRLTPP